MLDSSSANTSEDTWAQVCLCSWRALAGVNAVHRSVGMDMFYGRPLGQVPLKGYSSSKWDLAQSVMSSHSEQSTFALTSPAKGQITGLAEHGPSGLIFNQLGLAYHVAGQILFAEGRRRTETEFLLH